MTQARAPWGLVVVPLLFAAVCLPMALELIGPNGFYGVRTPATAASDAEWYRINQSAGIVGMIAGVIGFAANLLIARSQLAASRRTLACLAIVVAVALVMVVSSLAAA